MAMFSNMFKDYYIYILIVLNKIKQVCVTLNPNKLFYGYLTI